MTQDQKNAAYIAAAEKLKEAISRSQECFEKECRRIRDMLRRI